MLFDVNQFLKRFSASADADAENVFSTSRKAWHASNKNEPRCDFKPDRAALRFRGIAFVCVWRRSIYGQTLAEIKADNDMPLRFAQGTTALLLRIFGGKLDPEQWAVVTPPARRHLQLNFAQRCAAIIAANLGIPLFTDVAACKSRQRVNAVYSLINLPPQQNLIIFDDICTTGSTLVSMQNLLRPLGKNTFNIVGIDNH